MNLKIKYKNRLPHIAPVGAIFFITFRLGDSLPAHIIRELQAKMKITTQKLENKKPYQYKKQISEQRKRYFQKFEHQLDALPYGHCYLREPAIAKIIQDKLHEYDGSWYDLISYCIMPNHVHALFDTSSQLVDEQNIFLDKIPESYTQLYDIMQRIKGSTGYLANQLLDREGSFWAKDTYDHYVRNEQELFNIVNYIILNPRKAGLVKDWKEYPYTYIREGFAVESL